jgi:hypothetical protein
LVIVMTEAEDQEDDQRDRIAAGLLGLMHAAAQLNKGGTEPVDLKPLVTVDETLNKTWAKLRMDDENTKALIARQGEKNGGEEAVAEDLARGFVTSARGKTMASLYRFFSPETQIRIFADMRWSKAQGSDQAAVVDRYIDMFPDKDGPTKLEIINEPADESSAEVTVFINPRDALKATLELLWSRL